MGTLSLPTDNQDERLHTVGFPLPHSEMRVVDTNTGNTIPIGSEGELWVRGYGVTNGYWKEPEYARLKFLYLYYIRVILYKDAKIGFIKN